MTFKYEHLINNLRASLNISAIYRKVVAKFNYKFSLNAKKKKQY